MEKRKKDKGEVGGNDDDDDDDDDDVLAGRIRNLIFQPRGGRLPPLFRVSYIWL